MSSSSASADGQVVNRSATPTSNPAPSPRRSHANVRDSLRFFVAGSVAGMCGVVVGQPFDFVKVTMQTQELVAKQQGQTGIPPRSAAVTIPRADYPAGTVRSFAYSNLSSFELRSVAHSSAPHHFAVHTRHQPPAFAMGGGIGSWNGRGPALPSHAFSSAFVRTTPTMMSRVVAVSSSASVMVPRAAAVAGASSHPLFASPFACFMATLRSSGVRGLYRGMSSPLLLVGVQKSVAFGVFGTVSQHLQGPKPLPAMGDVCVAGIAGGIANSLVLTPIDQVKISMQIAGQANPAAGGSASQPPPVSMITTARTLIRQQGWNRGVYGNFRATLLREVPMYTVYYSLYSALYQSYIVDHRNQSRFTGPPPAGKVQSSLFRVLRAEHQENLTKLLIGGVTGVGCWAACFPLDTIKSGMAAQTAQNVPNSERMDIRRMTNYIYRR